MKFSVTSCCVSLNTIQNFKHTFVLITTLIISIAKTSAFGGVEFN